MEADERLMNQLTQDSGVKVTWSIHLALPGSCPELRVSSSTILQLQFIDFGSFGTRTFTKMVPQFWFSPAEMLFSSTVAPLS